MSRLWLSLSWAITWVVACTPTPDPSLGAQSASAVYGSDDRLEVYEHPSALFQRIARESVAVQMSRDHLDLSDPNDVQIVSDTLAEGDNLCAGERFATQPDAGRCSTALIARDMLLTAGHCVEDLAECQRSVYVFNYYYEAPGRLATITTDDIYRCESIVAQVWEDELDYAVIRLDRPVPPPHQPVSLREGDAALTTNDAVTVIGFGRGLPMKIDSGGQVLLPHRADRNFFSATTDTFNGNSGSSVFNAAGEVVGILARGNEDYVLSGECNRVNILPSTGEDMRGDAEESTYVARAVEAVCASGVPSDLCGDTMGVCRACAEDADCPIDSACLQNSSNASVSYCSAPCTSSSECAADHLCREGRCHPGTTERCHRGGRWEYDSCGRSVTEMTACEPGLVCRDVSCVAAMPGNACAEAEDLPERSQTLVSTLEAGEYGNSLTGSCGGDGIDKVFHFQLTAETAFVAVAEGIDTVLHLRSACDQPDTELACNDDSEVATGHGSAIEATLEPGDYYLIVDSYGRADTGSFVLVLNFDALSTADAGTTTPPPPEGGCQVSTSRTGPTTWGFLVAVVGVMLGARPRRPRRQSAP